MNFAEFILAFFLFIISYCETKFITNDNHVCYPKNVAKQYSEALNSIFLRFSSTKSDVHVKLTYENVSNCLIGLSNNFISENHGNKSINKLISAIVDSVIIPYCMKNKSEIPDNITSGYSSYKTWIYGILSVTVINACAVLGILFIPVRRKKVYKIILTFMIALAVGSLTGSALLILIPDAMQLTELHESSTGKQINFKYKATVVASGIYLFFLVERFLKWIINKGLTQFCREKITSQGSINISRMPKQRLEIENLTNEQCPNVHPEIKSISNHHDDIEDSANVTTGFNISTDVIVKNKMKKSVSTVAWMIICGDALHNFIDGLSIGAAFSKSIMSGISLSVAVLCEELPHELGDFAILLNAGMTIKQALFWNMMSAATCYIGLILGIILGETTSGSTWIFAVAGGMFLYISLVDMMPEMNAVLEDKECSEIIEFGILNTFLIQNVGLIFGYSILLVMALYGNNIQIN